MNKLTQIKTWRYKDIQSNRKYSRDTYFYMKNLHTNCEDKKPWDIRLLTYNSLYEIKV